MKQVKVSGIVISENKNMEEHLLFLLGLLNSKLITFYHFNSSPKSSKGIFPKLLIDDIKRLPIIDADKETISKINKLVKSILNKKENNEDTNLIQKEIDKIVYGLYNLNENEIKIIEGKDWI